MSNPTVLVTESQSMLILAEDLHFKACEFSKPITHDRKKIHMDTIQNYIRNSTPSLNDPNIVVFFLHTETL